MTWFKVDDGLTDHPKIIALGKDALPAMGLWTLVGAWAARYDTGGVVPETIVRRHDPRLRLARRLVEVGLWERELLAGNPQFKYHDWYDIQPSQEEVEHKKELNRERQRRYRLRRAGLEPDGPGPGGTSPPEDQAPRFEDLPKPVDPPSRNGARNALRDALVTVPRPVLTKKTTTTATADAAPKIVDRFDEWWSIYPRKVKKEDARKAWTATLRKKIDPEHLVERLRLHVAAWRAEGKDTQYIPYPASWLRGGSYDDELEQIRLSLVPAAPVHGTFDDIRANAAASEAARLLGIACILREQPPSDPTPGPEWIRRARLEWIEAHEQEIRDALTERKTG